MNNSSIVQYTRIRFSLETAVVCELMTTTSSGEVNVDTKNFQDLRSLLRFGIKIFIPVTETLQQHAYIEAMEQALTVNIN